MDAIIFATKKRVLSTLPDKTYFEWSVWSLKHFVSIFLQWSDPNWFFFSKTIHAEIPFTWNHQTNQQVVCFDSPWLYKMWKVFSVVVRPVLMLIGAPSLWWPNLYSVAKKNPYLTSLYEIWHAKINRRSKLMSFPGVSLLWIWTQTATDNGPNVMTDAKSMSVKKMYASLDCLNKKVDL